MTLNDPTTFSPLPSSPMLPAQSAPVMSEIQAEFLIAVVKAWFKLQAVKRCPPAQSEQGMQSVSDDMANALGNIMVHYDIKMSSEIVEKQPVES